MLCLLELVTTDGSNIADEQGLNILTEIGNTYTLGSGMIQHSHPLFGQRLLHLLELTQQPSDYWILAIPTMVFFRESGTSTQIFITPVPEPPAFLESASLYPRFRKSRLKRASREVEVLAEIMELISWLFF